MFPRGKHVVSTTELEFRKNKNGQSKLTAFPIYTQEMKIKAHQLGFNGISDLASLEKLLQERRFK